jgi:hypothetical protein
LLSSMKSSRHSGNGVHCRRSASSTKRLISYNAGVMVSRLRSAIWPRNRKVWMAEIGFALVPRSPL